MLNLDGIRGMKSFCVYLPRYIESTWFIWVSQMNHIPMDIDYDKNEDWVSTQVRISFLLEEWVCSPELQDKDNVVVLLALRLC